MESTPKKTLVQTDLLSIRSWETEGFPKEEKYKNPSFSSLFRSISTGLWVFYFWVIPAWMAAVLVSIAWDAMLDLL